MMRLKSKLLSLNASKPAHLKTRIFNPANCEELRIPIRKDKIVKVVGKLAESIQLNAKGIKGQDGTKESDEIDDQIITGAVLVENDLKLSLMDPEDLQEYAGLEATTLVCRQKLTLAAAGIDLIRWALEGTFGGLVELGSKEENSYSTLVKPVMKKHQEEADEEISRTPVTRFRVMDTVMVTHRNRGEIEVEWVGNMMNDGIADAVLAVLLSVESSPAAVKRKGKLFPQSRRNSLNRVYRIKQTPLTLTFAFTRQDQRLRPPQTHRFEEPARKPVVLGSPRPSPPLPRGAVRVRQRHAHRASQDATNPAHGQTQRRGK